MSNAQIQKYKYTNCKYTNTAYDKVPERPNMCHIFIKRIVEGYQKLYFHVSNMQIQNIHIQHITKCQKHPTNSIFLKRGLFKDITNDIPICQTGKYKNAGTQIHKYRAFNEVTEEKKNMWHICESVVQ